MSIIENVVNNGEAQAIKDVIKNFEVTGCVSTFCKIVQDMSCDDDDGNLRGIELRFYKNIAKHLYKNVGAEILYVGKYNTQKPEEELKRVIMYGVTGIDDIDIYDLCDSIRNCPSSPELHAIFVDLLTKAIDEVIEEDNTKASERVRVERKYEIRRAEELLNKGKKLVEDAEQTLAKLRKEEKDE